MSETRDHGGGLDAAVATFGGDKSGWVDLSTGINPTPYPITDINPGAWTALPDSLAQSRLLDAARAFWHVPDGASILAAPGASALIASLPALWPTSRVDIPAPTYNEHAAAFAHHGWTITEARPAARVVVHPNNPDGRMWSAEALDAPIRIIDESFCDVTPGASLVARATEPDTIVLKSFGKFWGLAGVRLGFAIGTPDLIERLAGFIGPWAVSGSALEIGTRALHDHDWANETRKRLAEDSARLDRLITGKGATLVGGTSLFRLYDVDDAAAWQQRLASGHVWSRIFPYSSRWLRLGLPAPDRWDQLEAAL